MIAYLGVGSNLGDRQAAIETVLRHLPERKDVQVLRCSPLYETEPVGLPEGSPDFLNGVIEIDTSLQPRALLEVLLCIEREIGRTRPQKKQYESRVIDLDILLYGEWILDEACLKIPHPRMTERWFVLKPLADLCATCEIPGMNCTVFQALRKLENSSQAGDD